MKILNSARKHGLNDRDIAWVATHPLRRIPLDNRDPHVEVRIGLDTQGRVLEVFVNVVPHHEEVVFHAMKARKQFTSQLVRRP